MAYPWVASKGERTQITYYQIDSLGEMFAIAIKVMHPQMKNLKHSTLLLEIV